MQRIAITGAAGFVGRQLPAHLRQAGFTGELRLFDRAFPEQTDDESIAIDLTAPDAVQAVLRGADCVIHLASLPGGAAEGDPLASRRINLDVPVALAEAIEGRRLVTASSIAVLGAAPAGPVDDATPCHPQSVYGTHKRMAELAFADAARRGELTGCCLRLPGIVARPTGAAGFGSAFMSEMFHAAHQGQPYRVPVAPEATMWLMSSRQCARNLAHAALATFTAPHALNLPCEHVLAGDLAASLVKAGCEARFTFAEDPALRRVFGSYPAITTAAADALGFRPDGGIAALVKNVLADLASADGHNQSIRTVS